MANHQLHAPTDIKEATKNLEVVTDVVIVFFMTET